MDKILIRIWELNNVLPFFTLFSIENEAKLPNFGTSTAFNQEMLQMKIFSNAFPSKFQTLTAFFSNTQKWIYSILEPSSSNEEIISKTSHIHFCCIEKNSNDSCNQEPA
jgi:hypothetical protein